MKRLNGDWFKHEYPVSACYSDFSFTVDLPGGWVINRALILPSGELSIEEICLKFPKENKRFIILDRSLPVYRPLTDPDFMVIPLLGKGVNGLDLRHFQTGDVKLGFSLGRFAHGDSMTVYYDCWKSSPND